jgi:hypothetical protein
MPTSPPATRNGGDRIAGRDFLLPVQAESTTPEPYGLYSYLLFGAEPSETARPRYIEVIRSYLQMLPPVQRLEREGAPRRMLNVTYVPVESEQAVAAAQSADAQAAETVLRNYSYARARVLLAKAPGGPHLDGPYVIPYREPGGGAAPGRGPRQRGGEYSSKPYLKQSAIKRWRYFPHRPLLFLPHRP